MSRVAREGFHVTAVNKFIWAVGGASALAFLAGAVYVWRFGEIGP